MEKMRQIAENERKTCRKPAAAASLRRKTGAISEKPYLIRDSGVADIIRTDCLWKTKRAFAETAVQKRDSYPQFANSFSKFANPLEISIYSKQKRREEALLRKNPPCFADNSAKVCGENNFPAENRHCGKHRPIKEEHAVNRKPYFGQHFLALLCVLLLLCGSALAQAPEMNMVFSFPGEFLEPGQAIVQTEDEYQSENVHIRLRGFFHEEAHTDVTVADIYIRTMDCFQRVFAQDADGHAASTLRRMNQNIQAILLMNGDNAEVGADGIMKRQKEKTNRELCLILDTGEMRCVSIGKAKEEGLYQHHENVLLNFCFGPSLLNADGYPILKEERFSTTDVFIRNPRSVLGYYEPGHYCFVVIGGRKTDSLFAKNKKNFGADLCITSQILYELGCKQAYNLDGGQSSAMMYLGNYQNSLYNNGRAVGDALMIGEPGADNLIKK